MSFRAVSGPVVYTAISVANALLKVAHRFLSVSPNWTTPDRKYHIHTGETNKKKMLFHLKVVCDTTSCFERLPVSPVLQFVPGHVDVRVCNFSESVEKGLTSAFAEVRRRSRESTNFTVQVSGTSGWVDESR